MTTPHLSLNTTTRMAYGENDELQVAIAVAGASLSGGVVAFDDHRKLMAICDTLVGFPKHASDEASFEYGIFDRVKARLAADAKGRVSATVLLEKYEGHPTDSYPESLSVRFWCDPSSIDEFCASIGAFVPGKPGEATLVGRSPDF
ncbi:hypothetical protein J2X90_005990 [Variovorax paradoxus]|uniref:hypothetical protein n=1 Tax=Variovorax paradoxus TaxID=34073 RepID=UPI002781905D|nr:hypothetical protein [Variovorax paradoxus]MDQ0028137.1 hypothetical protein [Variovorax paradoxus]